MAVIKKEEEKLSLKSYLYQHLDNVNENPIYCGAQNEEESVDYTK